MTVKLFAQKETCKGSPIWDVYVGETRTGVLRRLMAAEKWASHVEWGYKSLVANDDFQWATFQQAEESLRNFEPRKV